MLTSNRATNILLVLILAVGTGIVGMLATGVRGGPLDPAGTPAPSMRPLDEVLSAWNVKLASDDGPTPCQSSRFVCVFDDSAVLDRETGLVWERFLQTSPNPFGNARVFCNATSTAGRRGWRLPTTAELNSLQSFDVAVPPYIPAGHPFVNVQAVDPYWTSSLTINPIDNGRYRDLVWFDGSGGAAPETGETARYWCVRGGQGAPD